MRKKRKRKKSERSRRGEWVVGQKIEGYHAGERMSGSRQADGIQLVQS